MIKILVFGAGQNGKACMSYIGRTENELVGFLDNNPSKQFVIAQNGDKIPVYRPEEIINLRYDEIWVSNGRAAEAAQVERQLEELHVPREKIHVMQKDQALNIKILSSINQYDEESDRRVGWLRDYAGYAAEEGFSGNVAECGVCMGEFAYYINKYFPSKTLYLFDTFSGFDEKDLLVERSLNDVHFLNSMFNDQQLFAAANEQVVLGRMLHPEKCILKKGYFPETAEGMEDQFCFVNLDMDLYQPMLAGLRFFYGRMCSGGVILMHDYFHPELPGVKQAVKDFERENQMSLCKIPIGDFGSIAVIIP